MYLNALRAEAEISIPAVQEGCTDPLIVLSALKCIGLLQLPPLDSVASPAELDWETVDLYESLALMGVAEAVPSPVGRGKAERLLETISLYTAVTPLPQHVREEAKFLKQELSFLPSGHLAVQLLDAFTFVGDFSPEFSEAVSQGMERAKETLFG